MNQFCDEGVTVHSLFEFLSETPAFLIWSSLIQLMFLFVQRHLFQLREIAVISLREPIQSTLHFCLL